MDLSKENHAEERCNATNLKISILGANTKPNIKPKS